jgi:phosphoribosylformylglycinamidine cyclo-ligase
VIGLPSSGIHSNGLTLARKTLLQAGGMNLRQPVRQLGCTLGTELLRPTRIYVKQVLHLMDQGLELKALVHITGDGLLNLGRVEAPVGFVLDALPEPPAIFELIQEKGRVSIPEMYTVFNMGIGFCLVISPHDAERALELLRQVGEKPCILGKAVEDSTKAVLLTKQRIIGTEQFEKL